MTSPGDTTDEGPTDDDALDGDLTHDGANDDGPTDDDPSTDHESFDLDLVDTSVEPGERSWDPRAGPPPEPPPPDPPGYPAGWESDLVLTDGATVRMRPIRPDDVEAHRRFFDRLSRETVYYRFFTPKTHLTEAESIRFTNVDYVDRFAVVALLGEDIIAVGRYDRDTRRPEQAEVAFAVEDAHQGRGLGTALLEYLAAIARTHAITRFTATVLPDNRRMLRVFGDAGWDVHNQFADGIIEVAFPIEPTEASVAVSEERERQAGSRSIERILQPSSVALIGASATTGTIGHHLLENLVSSGFAGVVHAVNPRGGAIEGIPVHRSILDVAGPVDLAVVAVPAAAVPAVVRECAEKEVNGVVVISAGFSEAGPEGAALEDELLEVVRSHGMRLVGPNCIGVVNTAVGLNASFAPTRPLPGRVAFQSQSGGLGIALLEWTARFGIGISSFVSVGNKADVSGNDLLQYWEDDDGTDIVLLYLESFGNPRKFSRLARRISRTKPIVAVKSGRSPSGTRAARSHTASAASPDVVVSALFAQTGVIRVDTLEELLDVTQVLASQPLPRGERVAIVGNSGGPGILAADACEAAGLEVARLSAGTATRLRELLGPNAAVANPVDMVASAGPEAYEAALGLLIEDDNIDAVIVIYTPPMVSRPEEVAAAVARAARAADKPVIANFLASRDVPEPLLGHDGLRRIPSFTSPEPAARALGRVARYAAWCRRDPGTVPALDIVNRGYARTMVEANLGNGDGHRWLDLDVAASLLGWYGIPVAPTRWALDADQAVARADALGYPVAVKAGNGAIVHKTEAGGVHLGLADADAVRAAVAAIEERLGDEAGRLVVQPMIPTQGVEVIVGVVQDPSFGPLLMFGMGGVATELLADRAFRVLPLTDVDAHELVRSLRASALLFGFRGAPPVDIDALEDLLHRVAALAEDLPEIAELDLNPVLCTPDGVTALDAKIRVRPVVPGPPPELRTLD